MDSFEQFDLDESLMMGIQDMGYESPTEIQKQAIPKVLAGHDLIACAQTGTGKTGAFLIPLMQKLTEFTGNYNKSLILAPTRELAIQIDTQAEGLSYHSGISSMPIYGGSNPEAFSRQKQALQEGSDIIIATPGRLIQHINLGYVNLKQVRMLILDEADKMLDMGFYEDIMKIAQELPDHRQTLMFSATMPGKIRKLAKEILNSPEEINIAVSAPAEGINQTAYLAYDNQKPDLLDHLISEMEIDSMIIFASSKSKVNEITRVLNKVEKQAEYIHSDKDQKEREDTLNGFRNKSFRILVATDILSRGIDIENISHILNYDVPKDAEDYIHRIGRTARAESTGEAITFINPDDQWKFKKIEELMQREVPKLHPPADIGHGPAYNPGRGGGGGSRGGGRGKGKGGGGRRGGGGQRKPRDKRN